MSGLLRSNLIVAAGTALSRVTGLGRTLAVAYVLGGTFLSDAYLAANETPNIVYDLLLGGVLSATLVPLFTNYLADDEATEALHRRSTNVIITAALTLMVVLTAVAVIAAPLIFRLYSLDLADNVDADLYRQAGTTLARIFLIQILFYGIAGVANAYLNSRRRYFAAAWSPVVSNLVIIISLLSLPGAGSTEWVLTDVIENGRVRWTLGLGATAGIATMAFIVAPATVRAGLRFRPTFDFAHPAVKKLLVLSGWTIGFVGANQVAVVVIRNLANGLGGGNLTAYFYAFTFFVLPHGLLAVSVATTFQPELARSVKAGDRARFLQQMSLGIRSTAALTLPAAAALVALAEPVSGLMSRGRFGPDTLRLTAEALAGLSIGLAAFSIYLFVIRGFYAHQDTRTPFILNVGENALNIALAFLFVRWWGLFGLGLSYAVAYLVAAAWALVVLRNKVPGFSISEIRSSLWRLVLAAVLAAEAIWFVTHRVDGNDSWHGLAQLVVGGTVGIIVYAAALVALGAAEVNSALSIIQRRMGRTAQPAVVPEPPERTR